MGDMIWLFHMILLPPQEAIAANKLETNKMQLGLNRQILNQQLL